ncbi:hypothetical protein MARGE09_P2748 [Marinagarivorans cellulosilyticus]|uniref:GST N-terminal domain-containing protein n=1 Tax=Marinagarivorans cellulosilyticus TaxID=2721545 RepID=A0AAN1WJ91_9GAMM|nr:hypothetical protein MARGE09_P2748 [Marinagarivorans cellulosilyticus]
MRCPKEDCSVLPVLYSFRRCPYAMRARLALAMSGCAVVLREVSLKAKPSDMLKASPKGTVPVMVLPCGRVIDESLEIMAWAFEQGQGCSGKSGGGSLSVPNLSSLNLSRLNHALIEVNDTHFKCWLDRYKYADRYRDYTQEQSRAEASVFIMSLESHLKHQPYLSGEHFGFLDAAIAPFVRQFSGVEPHWFEQQRDWPHVLEWLSAFKCSELFSAIMLKYSPWCAQKDNAEVCSWGK